MMLMLGWGYGSGTSWDKGDYDMYHDMIIL